MNNKKITYAVLAMTAVLSCQKEAYIENTTHELERAVLCAGEMTRTSLNGSEVHWSSDDILAVFDNTNTKNQFSVSETSGSSAIFEGAVALGTTQIYAVYPYTLANSANGSTLSINIPADQTSKSGSFAEEHNISVAKAVKTPGVENISNVTFKNVCSYLKFTVPTYIKDIKNVTLSSNSIIAGDAAIDYSGDTPTLTLGDSGSKSITMKGTYEAGSTFWFVLAPVTLDGFTVTIETAQDTWQISRTTQVELTAGNYRNLGTLTLEEVKATASAAHTYEGSTLTGTNVVVNLNIPKTVATYDPVASVALDIKNSSGTVVRTHYYEGNSSTINIGADDNWPYLPAGAYTVSGTYTLASGTAKNIETSFSTGAPANFTVNAPAAYTSYSKYLAGDSSAANGCDPLTVYNIKSASVNISSAILSNSNYTSINKGFAYTLNGAAVTSSNVTVSAYGNQTVNATYTFDGVAKSGAVNCHITGLPYTLNVSANDAINAWETKGDVKFANTDRGTAVRVGHGLGNGLNTGESSITKTFNLPADINVAVSATGEAHGSKFLWTSYTTTGSVKVSGTVLHSATAKGEDSYVGFSGAKNAVMTSASPQVQLHNSNSTNTACTYFTSLVVNYGNK